MNFVRDRGFSFIPLLCQPDNQFETTARLATHFGAHWLIVDLPYPDIDIDALEAINATVLKVIFIDDARFIFPRVEAVLNSSIMAPGEAAKIASAATRQLVGPEYFIMEKAAPVSGSKAIGSPSILLTFGGSDPTALTPRAIAALTKQEWGQARFSVVLGPGYGNSEEMVRLTDGNDSFKLLQAPQSLLAEMTRHDLIISSGGRTMYEAFTLGIPFLPVASAPHEANEIKALAAQGMVSHYITEWGAESFIDAVRSLIESTLPLQSIKQSMTA